jgi:hypothetical protein
MALEQDFEFQDDASFKLTRTGGLSQSLYTGEYLRGCVQGHLDTIQLRANIKALLPKSFPEALLTHMLL